VALTGEEIKHRLTEFAAEWTLYTGSERGGAQTFLDELFLCYGTRRKEVAQLEDPQEGKFLDLIWPRPDSGSRRGSCWSRIIGYGFPSASRS
jgi:hypothetical protein